MKQEYEISSLVIFRKMNGVRTILSTSYPTAGFPRYPKNIYIQNTKYKISFVIPIIQTNNKMVDIYPKLKKLDVFA